MRLEGLLSVSAGRGGDRVAVVDTLGGSMTYAALDAAADRVARLLRARGVGRGDRVGLWMGKRCDAVACIFGILRCGAAYVPIDPAAPVARARGILEHCRVAATVVDAERVGLVEGEGRGAPAREPLANDDGEVHFVCGPSPTLPLRSSVGHSRGTLTPALSQRERETARRSARPRRMPVPTPERRAEATDVAYVLYTSGSTGVPKGVVHTHASAMSFVDWAMRSLGFRGDDRFSSHAPFSFDLSILDLFVAIGLGAIVVLIDERSAKDPRVLPRVIEAQRISVWYSVPSALCLMLDYGGLASRDLSSLRVVCFAGEVFPVDALRRLRGCLPGRAMYNLFGPTETNVCTSMRIPEVIPEVRATPYPIGRACDHCATMVLADSMDSDGHGGPSHWGSDGGGGSSHSDADGRGRPFHLGSVESAEADGSEEVRPAAQAEGCGSGVPPVGNRCPTPEACGSVGELLVRADGAVMAGYFEDEDATARAFRTDERGERWYRTGDLVRVNGEGDYEFLGRRDRMIKKSGYRIELGEIEAVLQSAPGVRAAAVIAVGAANATAIHAFVERGAGESIGVLRLRAHCAAVLPSYMVPDRFAFLEQLPRTGTGKTDLAALRRSVGRGGDV